MLISGFCMVRNATKLYYPVKASIESILPIVDEFVVALGNCDPDDQTLLEIEKIGSPKIKIIHSVWDTETYSGGSEYARQTDIAKKHCSGKWLFYLQSDEAVHEKYHSYIRQKCADLQDESAVEGMLFKYCHFWGDYQHHIVSHVWYSKEIRIIRNLPDIHSWRDAQSFRRIPDFDGKSYFMKKETFKLKVIQLDAYIYHYGWVRPPQYMQRKKQSLETDFHGKKQSAENPEDLLFDYGDLSKLTTFKQTHPAVMQDFIAKFDWQHLLYPQRPAKIKHKHDRLKYRVLTWVEQRILGGRQIGGFKNYILLKDRQKTSSKL